MAVSIISFSSCSKVDNPADITETNYPVSVRVLSSSKTKITVNDEALAWEDDDILRITAVSDDKKSAVSDLSVYPTDEENGHSTSFTGFVTMESDPKECYFTYPSGDALRVDAGSAKILARFNMQDGSHKPFLYSKVGYSPNITTELKFVGAMLEIDVQDEDVCSLVFYGNKREDIYPVFIDPDNNGSISDSEEVGYEIIVPVQSEGHTYICIPPVKFEKGFTLELRDASGNKMLRSFGVLGGYDFSDKRGHIIPIELSEDFLPFGIACELESKEDGAYHIYKDNLIYGTQISFSMSKSGLSNSLIESWGATLVDSKGTVVRKYESVVGGDLKGDKISLGVVGNYKILPAGTYTFTPYCKIYGLEEQVSLGSSDIQIKDPGIKITLGGETSYDKYMARDTSGANNCTNTTIYGVSASINVHPKIIDSLVAMLDNEDITSQAKDAGLSKVEFDNLTRGTFKKYEYKVTVKVGNLTFSATKDFHITGLPMEVDFENGNNGAWGVINGSIGNVVEFNSDGQSALRSPKFHVPTEDNTKDLYVKTAFDGCGKNVYYKVPILNIVADKEEYLDIYFIACSDNQTTVEFENGNNCVRAQYEVIYKATGYRDFSQPMQLTEKKPSIMYSASNNLYTKHIYKVKILYSEKK